MKKLLFLTRIVTHYFAIMISINRWSWILAITLLIISCDSTPDSDKKEKITDGIVKQYRKDGTLKAEIGVKDGQRHGLSKTYYKNKKLHQEINYINNKKHGIAKTYHKNGKIYQETLYDSGIIHGVRKKYRENGKLWAEIPFHKGKEAAGLKEYLLDGSLKRKYPKIVIMEKNEIIAKNKVTLEATLSDNSKKVEFYTGTLDDGKFFGVNAGKIYSQKNGKAEIVFNVLPGMFIMKEINIIAKVTTVMGNSYITQKSYNLAVEN